ncbi:hypothetical protein EI171_29130 [Bradyrhizobium sp. LCT2]|uniref:hypothetical protein n=1 Tax=Bradyrhizobium sp. LCT2 TaxID=2493093 RepID=UPI00137437D7|nr:hypothetical protein [Bradyrhizobium sp. LCT2]QHP70999.1 hypothetical protein EI171_29130 [Bradyrhizobium sp. LCT2]
MPIAKERAPITVRGVCYTLFVQKLIASMEKSETSKVSRLLTIAREEGTIPWEQIVDETRQIEEAATWDSPEEYMAASALAYRLNFWQSQPHRVQVWSEKGTIRGVLQPVLDEFAIPFMVVHGYASATVTHDIANDNDGRPLHILYVGDLDPSGANMSAVDLPKRFAEYGGTHIKLKRIALTPEQVVGLPSFPAADKRGDTRYSWFVRTHGRRCWELDAMDPRDLRGIVKREIKKLINKDAWRLSEITNEAQQESMREFFRSYKQ